MRRKSTKRLFSIIVALMAIQNGEIFSQEIKKIPTVLTIEMQPVSFKSLQKLIDRETLNSITRPEGGKVDAVPSKKLLQPLGGGYFSDHLTFFCRTELKLEKAIQVPVKFRLGSVAYTDYLERKPNAVKP
ncbi:MAG: hypothetical protein EOO05_19855 [Chitinophagaceae bacterium]|jgi:hypothetical protein|nr:MAG: hypothetical protein EOO05_19855 [Chitinophagaceae bacterium]